MTPASSVSAELLAILVCPETRQTLMLADSALLAQLNQLQASGTLKNRANSVVSEVVAAGLLREDSQILYPIVDGIPIMLIEESIPITIV